MNLKEVEIVMTPEELLKALWWGERSDAQISFSLSSMETDWKIKSLYFTDARVGSAEHPEMTRPASVVLTIEQREEKKPDV